MLLSPLPPRCSYGTNAKTRHLLPNGFYKFLVHNVADLEMLLMHNRRYCAEIAGAVSARTRKVSTRRQRGMLAGVVHAALCLRVLRGVSVQHYRLCASPVAASTRPVVQAIVERAAQLGVRVTNGAARLTAEESS